MHPSLADSPVDGRWAVDGVRHSLGSGSVSKFSFFFHKRTTYFSMSWLLSYLQISGDKSGDTVVGKVSGGLELLRSGLVSQMFAFAEAQFAS